MRSDVCTSTLQSPVTAAGDEWGGVPLSHYDISRLTRGSSLGRNPAKRQTANKSRPKRGRRRNRYCCRHRRRRHRHRCVCVVCTSETQKGRVKISVTLSGGL